MQLLVSSPWWFILICLLCGFIYAALLYKPHLKHFSHKIMALLRFLSISFISFFLLGPVLIQIVSEIQKPKIILVLDNSESIRAAKEFKSYQSALLKKWYQAQQTLGPEYEIEFLNLGQSIRLSDSADFNQKRSHLSALFDYVNNTYARENIGAVVFASDGIYNSGNNPVYKTLNKHVPLYSIGLGDTAIKKDVILREANHNAIAYLNNKFPVELNLAAYACQGQQVTLAVTSEGKTLFSEQIQINQGDFYKSVLVELEAEQAGSRHFIATVSRIDGEVTFVNNKKDIFIDIIDGREKIVLAYAGPHPDIAAIKAAINSNQNYEVVEMPVQQIKLADLKQYSVAILYQIPGKTESGRDFIAELKKNKIPIWCIVGKQSQVENLSLVNPMAKIDRNQGKYNESQAVLNSQFHAFTLDEKVKSTLSGLPPLQVPYGVYAATGNTEVLAYQKIGQVETGIPLWTFSNQNGEKSAYLFGEGYWRWRLFDYVQNETHAVSNELVSKTIQYLAVKEDKRKFRVYPVKKVYDEDETVRFIAEMYNASYEPINQADVKLSISNSSNKVFNYVFSKNGKSYQLDLGLLSPGIYNYVASTDVLNEKIKGKFIVSALQTEMVNTRADFNLLRQIAHKNNGRFYPAGDFAKALEAIKENTSISSVAFSERRPEELINLKYLFFLIVVLLSAEWFIRKYEGAY